MYMYGVIFLVFLAWFAFRTVLFCLQNNKRINLLGSGDLAGTGIRGMALLKLLHCLLVEYPDLGSRLPKNHTVTDRNEILFACLDTFSLISIAMGQEMIRDKKETFDFKIREKSGNFILRQ